MNKTKIVNKQDQEIFSCSTNLKKSCLYADWIGDIQDVENAKKACIHMVSLAKEHGLIYILNDNRRQTGDWPQLGDWLVREWIPMLANAGILYFAHVMSPDEKTKRAAHQLFNKVICGVEFVTFSSYSSARYWLNTRER